MNIATAVEFHSRWTPQSPAVTAAGRRVTWAELEEQTRRVGAALRRQGVSPRERVAILASNSLEWCVLTVAILRAGAILVPINVRSTSAEIGYIIEKVDARAVAVDFEAGKLLAPIILDRPSLLTISLDDKAEAQVTMAELRAGAGDLTTHPAQGHDPALIPFTSGTTGYPKGVTLTHDNVRSMAEAYAHFDSWGSDSVALCFAPLAFNGGVTNAFLGMLLSGGHLILEEFSPRVALERIVNDRVTVISGVPIVYESIAALTEFDDADLSSVLTATTGGAVVQDTLLSRWASKGVALRQAYGLTEATGPITIVPRQHFRTKARTAGVPGMWDRVRVVDQDDRELSTGEVGEIVISGPQVMAGYWGDPQETAITIRDGWLHTGDMGAFDEDGFLSIVDRKKDLIISGGINVYPAEIERVVGQFDGVEECVAYGVAHDKWGETVAVLVAGSAIDVNDLYRHTKSHLSDYKVPRYITLAKEPLPRSAFGKLLRRSAAELFDPSIALRTPST